MPPPPPPPPHATRTAINPNKIRSAINFLDDFRPGSKSANTNGAKNQLRSNGVCLWGCREALLIGPAFRVITMFFVSGVALKDTESEDRAQVTSVGEEQETVTGSSKPFGAESVRVAVVLSPTFKEAELLSRVAVMSVT